MGKTRNKSGDIKASLHVAVKESTHDKLQATARKIGGTMGSLIDELVENCLSLKGGRR